jgi:hypothetical protein
MRQFVASVLIIGTITSALAAQAPAAGKPRIGACSLLTRDVIMKFGTENGKRFVDLLKPNESPMGTSGSSCGYGGIQFQLDPFPRSEQLRKSPQKDWQAVSGVGETAYFHNNANRWAELMVWSGAHHFTIQQDVPMGSTAEAMKPNTIALANYIITKLR